MNFFPTYLQITITSSILLTTDFHSRSTLKTAFASVHELSVHVHEGSAGIVHVHVQLVPENSCCAVGHVNSYF